MEPSSFHRPTLIISLLKNGNIKNHNPVQSTRNISIRHISSTYPHRTLAQSTKLSLQVLNIQS